MVGMPQPHPSTLSLDQSTVLMVVTTAKGTAGRNVSEACRSTVSSGWGQALETPGLALLWVPSKA